MMITSAIADAAHNPRDVVGWLIFRLRTNEDDESSVDFKFTCHKNGPSTFPRHWDEENS
jgi:hypothetical protein